MEVFETELLTAIRDRPAGEPIVAAFGRFVLQPRGALAAGNPDAARYLAVAARMIASSPALLARERQILARYTDSLAALITEDTGAEAGDLRPLVVAHALIGTHQALIKFVHRHVLDGPTDQARLASELKTRGRQALDLLEEGLAAYGGQAP
jgi:hypothetical protein